MAAMQRQLTRIRRKLEGARLYAGLSGHGAALALVARLERIQWKLERSVDQARRRRIA